MPVQQDEQSSHDLSQNEIMRLGYHASQARERYQTITRWQDLTPTIQVCIIRLLMEHVAFPHAAMYLHLAPDEESHAEDLLAQYEEKEAELDRKIAHRNEMQFYALLNGEVKWNDKEINDRDSTYRSCVSFEMQDNAYRLPDLIIGLKEAEVGARYLVRMNLECFCQPLLDLVGSQMVWRRELSIVQPNGSIGDFLQQLDEDCEQEEAELPVPKRTYKKQKKSSSAAAQPSQNKKISSTAADKPVRDRTASLIEPNLPDTSREHTPPMQITKTTLLVKIPSSKKMQRYIQEQDEPASPTAGKGQSSQSQTSRAIQNGTRGRKRKRGLSDVALDSPLTLTQATRVSKGKAKQSPEQEQVTSSPKRRLGTRKPPKIGTFLVRPTPVNQTYVPRSPDFGPTPTDNSSQGVVEAEAKPPHYVERIPNSNENDCQSNQCEINTEIAHLSETDSALSSLDSDTLQPSLDLKNEKISRVSAKEFQYEPSQPRSRDTRRYLQHLDEEKNLVEPVRGVISEKPTATKRATAAPKTRKTTQQKKVTAQPSSDVVKLAASERPARSNTRRSQGQPLQEEQFREVEVKEEVEEPKLNKGTRVQRKVAHPIGRPRKSATATSSIAPSSKRTNKRNVRK